MGLLSSLFGAKNKQTPPPIPKNSIAMMAPQADVSELGVSAYRNVAEYLKRKHGCQAFEITRVEGVAAEPDLAIDGRGRIHKGACSERWHIKAGAKNLTLKMAFGSDGRGGSLVGIGE